MEVDSLPTADQKPPKLRWFHPTPGRLLIVLLAVEGVLLLSEWFGWFAFNGQTWTVLIALAAVGATVLLMFFWLAIALLFHWRFQFTLRSLLLLAVAVTIACSWVATEMQQERRQKAAAEALGKFRSGSRVQTDMVRETLAGWFFSQRDISPFPSAGNHRCRGGAS